jgi:predicted  nucleic acid-binding Zn ribbon protein
MDRSTEGLRPEEAFEGRIVHVEAIAERHREGLREAAEQEPQIHRYTGMYSIAGSTMRSEAERRCRSSST